MVNADLVLVAATQTYCQRYELDEVTATGLGAVCEARAIRQLLYDVGGINEKFRVILFAEEDNNHVPVQLKGYHRFLLDQEKGYSDLLTWLQPAPAPAASSGQDITIPWPSPAPDYVWPLADRKDEFSLFERMITGQSSQRILLVQGMSNTGKTVLSAELRAYARSLKMSTASLDFKGCPSLNDLFEALLLDLASILRNTQEASETKRAFQLIADLQQIHIGVREFYPGISSG